MGERTDEIFEQIKEGTYKEKEDDFVERSETLKRLREDIDAVYKSRNRLAEDCALQPSHLSNFLNGTKGISRDKLLALFICIGYDLDQIQTMLRRLSMPELYVRDMRDYQIAACVKEKKSLGEIEEILSAKNLKSLAQYADDKESGSA